ncbi:MAG: tail fiber domain-containing protein [Caulobacteraceae bacterium]|nr:tail fiber domain-containing protein [Caulobacteraceae bacterium]
MTPSAWGLSGTNKAIQLLGASVFSLNTQNAVFGQNVYHNGTNFLYQTTDVASVYRQSAAQHQWFTAPSGTAGNTISFGDAKMTLQASGGLALGVTTDPGAGNIQLGSGAYVGTGIGTGNTTGTYYGTNEVRFYTSASARATIDSSGNVGIGTTSPSTYAGASGQLIVYGGVATTFTNNPTNMTLVNNGTIAAGLGCGINFSMNYDNTVTTTYGLISCIRENATSGNPAGALVFGTRDSGGGVTTERMRITSSGNLLIGTTTVGSKLTVADNISIHGAGNTIYAESFPTTASAANVYIGASNSYMYRSTSALKYKQDIRDLEEIDINKFRPVRYKSKCKGDDQTKDHFGLIADEVDSAGIKELVTYGADGEVEGFQYERLTIVLLKHCQEQQALIESLTSRVAQLEGTQP